MDDFFYNITSSEDHEQEPVHDKPTDTVTARFRVMCTHLAVPTNIERSASVIFQEVVSIQKFRGEPLLAMMGSSLYVAFNLQGFSRDAKELCTPLGIDYHVFTRTLKVMYEILPDIARRMSIISQDDSVLRQVQSITDIPLTRTWEVIKEVRVLESVRKAHKILLGSPPAIINAILIYKACTNLGMSLNKCKYVDDAQISRATLEKHLKHLHTLV